jgi:hypothetical protein
VTDVTNVIKLKDPDFVVASKSGFFVTFSKIVLDKVHSLCGHFANRG